MKQILRYSFIALLAMVFGNATAATVIYESNVLSDWTADNKSLPDAVTYVWKAGTSYMKGSAYVSGTNYATESWLISPEIDLTSATAPTLSFEHAGNYYGDQASMKSMATMWFKVNGGEWAQVEIKYYPNGTSWNFEINSVDLASYVGKKIQVAYKYTSTDEKAGTWEIKNFIVKDGSSDPNEKGGELNPYSVEEVQALTEANLPSGKVWVEGYIAGCVNTANGSELATEYTNSNIGLSQTGTVTTVIPIQLPSGSVRTALNLVDNASNLGKGVVVYGSIAKYCGVIGVKSVSNYVFNEKSVDIVTGINKVKAEQADGAIYNAAGQKVNAGYKGLVILNGKKYVNK